MTGARGCEVGARLRSRAAPGLARTTRRMVTDEASRAGASESALHSIELLATELVTNAVRYGPPDGVVEVCARRHGSSFQVSVRDGSPESPSVSEAEPTASGGRGMWLVDRLSSRWGVRKHAQAGKSVWFTVPLAGIAAGELPGHV